MTKQLQQALGLCLITILTTVQLSHGYTIIGEQDLRQTDSYWAQATQNDEATPTPTLTKGSRNPGVAVGLATFPGLIIHGSGHFYAGRPLTAGLLFLVEAGAVYMTYRGISDIWAVADENLADDISDITVIENLEETGQLSRGIGLAAGGLLLFISSWLYDMTGSPIAVMEENIKEQQKAGPKVNAKLTLTGFELEFGQLF